MKIEETNQDFQEDPINPNYYWSNSTEVIEVIESFKLNFCLGNAIKYILRAGKKGDKVEDLKKARWYVQREIDSDESDKKI